ncbi:MAG: hypothetical protein ACR2OI_12565 [Acidimicrobiia bacterium]
MTRQRVGLVTAWFLATFLAVAVASQAVGLVADRAVEIPVQVPVAVAQQSSLGPLVADPAPQPEPTPPTTVEPNPAAPPTTATTATSATGGTTITSPGNQATTTTLASTTSTTVGATTTTTTAPLLDSGSFVAIGGQVTAACTGLDTVKLLGAVPVAGWSLEVESEGPNKVRVDFEAGSQETEIEITCSNGQLSAEIEE